MEIIFLINFTKNKNSLLLIPKGNNISGEKRTRSTSEKGVAKSRKQQSPKSNHVNSKLIHRPLTQNIRYQKRIK